MIRLAFATKMLLGPHFRKKMTRKSKSSETLPVERANTNPKKRQVDRPEEPNDNSKNNKGNKKKEDREKKLNRKEKFRYPGY